MRTTCVATQLEGGHATNALPQLAAANVNCRVLPEDSVEDVLAALKKVVADDQVSVTVTINEGRSPASPMRPDVLKAIARDWRHHVAGRGDGADDGSGRV